jgi:hypothetical protein
MLILGLCTGIDRYVLDHDGMPALLGNPGVPTSLYISYLARRNQPFFQYKTSKEDRSSARHSGEQLPLVMIEYF